MGTQTQKYACLESRLTTAEEYNTIKYFTAKLPFGIDNIRRLGEIILRYGLEDQVGALYVHRHFEMPSDSILLKRAPSGDIEIARMCPSSSFDRKDINGISFRLIEGQRFQAFEYAVNFPTSSLPASFLNDLAQFLVENRLDDVLGLFVRTPSNQQASCELNLAKLRVSVSVPLKDVPDGARQEATPASWVYSSTCDDPHAANFCTEPNIRCSHKTEVDSDTSLFEIITDALQKRGLAREISLLISENVYN